MEHTILNIDLELIKNCLGCDVTETAVRHDHGCSCQVHYLNFTTYVWENTFDNN